MDDYEVYKKVKEAIAAIDEYKIKIARGDSSLWKKEINEGLIELNEKRHVLSASGNVCNCCNGSGRQ